MRENKIRPIDSAMYDIHAEAKLKGRIKYNEQEAQFGRPELANRTMTHLMQVHHIGVGSTIRIEEKLGIYTVELKEYDPLAGKFTVGDTTYISRRRLKGMTKLGPQTVRAWLIKSGKINCDDACLTK